MLLLHPLADGIAASSSRSLSPHWLNCSAALTAPLRTFAQKQPADVCGVDRDSCSSRPGGSHHHQLTCATVHPSISAPLPVLTVCCWTPHGLLWTEFLSQLVTVSHFRAFFFSRSRDKSLTLPFSVLPIHITTTTSCCVWFVTAKEWRGCLSGALTSFGRSRFIPQRFYFHSHSIFPNSLISRFHCHLPPHTRPRPIPGAAPFPDSYLRRFILPILHSTNLPYPLIFSSISLSPTLFALQRFLLSPLGTQK